MSAATAPPADRGLLERERELATLAALVEGAAAGEARIALIEGPAGIGKSRLLGEARREASERGTKVLQARGGEFEREFPFGVVRQLFEPVLTDPETRELGFAGAAASARAVFEPVEADAAGTDASFAALHGLYWLVVNLASEHPLLLAIDDLHWADRPSLRFFLYLARRLEGLPVLLAATLRPAEPDSEAALLGELAGDPLVVPVRPGHLSEAAVAQLVRDRFGDDAEDAFAAACQSATGGNPLLLSELLKALRTEEVAARAANAGVVAEIGPRAASRAVLLRLARLPGETVEVARAIAILGDGADLGSVAGLSGLDEAAAAAATGSLARAEIIRREAPLGFVHPLVRAAVYHDIPPGERELRHERAVRLLADAGAPAEQIAAHVLALPARGDEERAATLATAARDALAKGAAESAVAYLTRALDETQSGTSRGRLLFELGTAETRVNGPAATEHLRQAVDLLDDPLEHARASEALARTAIFTLSPEEATGLVRKAQAELPPDAADMRQRLEALELFTLMFSSDWRAVDRFTRDHEPAPGDGAGSSMIRGLSAWHAAARGEPAAECVRIARAALEDSRLIADEGSLLAFPPTIVLTLADQEDALQAWDVIRRRLNDRGSLFSAGGVYVWRGYTLWLRGELEEALAELRAARQLLDLWGDPGHGTTYSGSMRANVLIERGELDEARLVLEGAGYPQDGSERSLLWLIAWVRLHLAAEPAVALRAIEDLEDRLAGRDNPTYLPWRPLKAQALHRLGRAEEAVALAEEALVVARRWGAAGAVGSAMRILGTLEGEAGIPRLEEGIALLEGTPARLELAKGLTALGAAMRRLKRERDAREPLRRGFELAELCGAAPVAELARTELHASGARPRASALSGPDALTPSERRVVELAAEGHTNRDIAQALFVTPKTVEVHLSNSYRKLGIASRRELKAALAA